MPGKIYLSASAKVTSNSGYSCYSGYSGYCTGRKCTCHSNTEKLETLAMTRFRFILQFLSACFMYFASYFLVQQCTAVYSSVQQCGGANTCQYHPISQCNLCLPFPSDIQIDFLHWVQAHETMVDPVAPTTPNTLPRSITSNLSNLYRVYRLSPIPCGLLTLYRC